MADTRIDEEGCQGSHPYGDHHGCGCDRDRCAPRAEAYSDGYRAGVGLAEADRALWEQRREALEERVAELEAEVERLEAEIDATHTVALDALRERDEARAENERLRALCREALQALYGWECDEPDCGDRCDDCWHPTQRVVDRLRKVVEEE